MTVLAPLLRTRTSAVWLVLTLATVLSWALGHNHGGQPSVEHERVLESLEPALARLRFVGSSENAVACSHR